LGKAPGGTGGLHLFKNIVIAKALITSYQGFFFGNSFTLALRSNNFDWRILRFENTTMTKFCLKGFGLFLVIFMLSSHNGSSQEKTPRPLRLMFYNVENLFDIFDDTLKNDDDFLPNGVLRWNYTRYNSKINSIYKTIIAAGEWSPPEIVALCEVENRKVLEDLVYGSYLSKFKYNIIHEESPDQRGIDVCLIYRREDLELIDYCYLFPKEIKEKDFFSRKILYSKFLYNDDTIHVFVNHWPSRRGGVLAGEGMRIKISSMVREKADSISKCNIVGNKIIILGDFNSSPDDQEMKILTSSPHIAGRLINLSTDLSESGIGTYRYQGTWEMLDQVLVSENLLSSSNGLYTAPSFISVFRPDFLLMKDPKYPGFTPFSTYRGFRYQGGFSDHLPIVLRLNLMEQDRPE
jgi:predicted extracellular nuclease